MSEKVIGPKPEVIDSKVSINFNLESNLHQHQQLLTRILTNERNNKTRAYYQNKLSEVMKERYSMVVPSARVGDYVTLAVPK